MHDHNISDVSCDVDDMQTVQLATAQGHSFTLRFTMRAAGKLFADAHDALNSVACATCRNQGQNNEDCLRLPNTG